MKFENILQAIGNTPLIRLNRITQGLKVPVYIKAEFLNPGGSVKDRIAVSMIEDAEKRGLLKPGGTIIEGTSGNTGIGLALVAALKGYKIVFTITDKQSREKINFLKALGAEVIVCPTAVAPEDPRSYYSVAKALAKEIPNAYYPNQYDNPKNPEAHYKTTGPEIWRDTESKITHFVAGIGTGGTLSGVGKYLKEKNPKIKIIAVDPEGSLYYDYFHQKKVVQAHPYKVEGIGEDFFPTTMDFKVVDDVIRVTDRDSFLMTRKLARTEGIFSGGSSGSAMWAGLQVAKKLTEKDLLVILIPDTGMRYLSKIYNEEWMSENQYFEAEIPMYAAELVRAKRTENGGRRSLISIPPQTTCFAALEVMRKGDISQLPVIENDKLLGEIHEDDVLNLLLVGKEIRKMIVREVMSDPPPVVDSKARIEALVRLIRSGHPAVLVQMEDGETDILTKYDILHAATRVAEQTR
ncbi:MAG: cystathionine beta-synthase [Elusimicrobia bacterium]|nr:cystathionine beta-synthase [Elusimicrobiota bacterium]